MASLDQADRPMVGAPPPAWRPRAAISFRDRWFADSLLEEAGFELLVPRINRRATVLSLQGSHTLSGEAGQLQS